MRARRQANVTVFIGYQSLAQLRDIWGKKAQTMLDCCDVILSGGSKSAKDYQEFGQLAGTRTVKVKPGGNEVSRPLWAAEDGFGTADDTFVALLGSRPARLSKAYSLRGAGLAY